MVSSYSHLNMFAAEVLLWHLNSLYNFLYIVNRFLRVGTFINPEKPGLFLRFVKE